MRGGIGDVLIGHFSKHNETGERIISVRLESSPGELLRDLCWVEKEDCRSKKESKENIASRRRCPARSTTRKCNTFKWDQIEFDERGEARTFCIAKNTDKEISLPDDPMNASYAMHDRNTCGDLAATRIWFKKSNGQKMFHSLMEQAPNSMTVVGRKFSFRIGHWSFPFYRD